MSIDEEKLEKFYKDFKDSLSETKRMVRFLNIDNTEIEKDLMESVKILKQKLKAIEKAKSKKDLKKVIKLNKLFKKE